MGGLLFTLAHVDRGPNLWDLDGHMPSDALARGLYFCDIEWGGRHVESALQSSMLARRQGTCSCTCMLFAGGDSMSNLILARALSSNTVNSPVKSTCQILSNPVNLLSNSHERPRAPSSTVNSSNP